MIAPLAALAALALAGLAYFATVFLWSARRGRGARYFGLPLADRQACRRRLAGHGPLMIPIGRVISLVLPNRMPAFTYRGVAGPSTACSRELFERTERYRPDGRDIFVATQMRCGTTWMQQVVYEILSRGRGDLSDGGHRHMYALSPWIESFASVELEHAPRVGERGLRIIKTHMPTRLCPYSEQARYIYVLRHPVACFASSVDFLRLVAGPLAPNNAGFVRWFCSDAMFWLPWPEHADGWWRWAKERPNVLFVHYEEMLDDLPAVVRRVAALLETPLQNTELAEVVRKSGFEYMKQHEDVFEMSAPTPFSHTGVYLKSGKKSRDRDVGEREREAVLAYCREKLVDAAYPASRFYPDLA